MYWMQTSGPQGDMDRLITLLVLWPFTQSTQLSTIDSRCTLYLFWFKAAFTCGYCYGYRYCFFVFFVFPTHRREVWRPLNLCTHPHVLGPGARARGSVCSVCVPVVEVNMCPPGSVCPVRGALISKQDVKHFSADPVLVIASPSRVVNALKIVCPQLSKLISPYCPEQHKNTPQLSHMQRCHSPSPPPSTGCFYPYPSIFCLNQSLRHPVASR